MKIAKDRIGELEDILQKAHRQQRQLEKELKRAQEWVREVSNKAKRNSKNHWRPRGTEELLLPPW